MALLVNGVYRKFVENKGVLELTKRKYGGRIRVTLVRKYGHVSLVTNIVFSV